MYRKLIIILLVVFCLNASTVLGQSREGDSLALVDLYNSTNGDSWNNKTNWLSGPIDTWYGVTVSGGRVTRLYLYSNNLTGTIPSSIGNLTSLKELYLYGNQLSGSIPSSIGNLTDLDYLWLYNNNLTGSIPPEIGNLADLDYLYLNSNQLIGSIPSEFANLSLIYDMRLNNNDFEDLPDISGLRWLRKLYIQNNKFTFEDIEPNLELSATVVYSPQDSVGNVQNDTITEGANLTISVSVGGEHNEYQWKKDGSVISGATNDSYTITSAEMSDAGSYTCEITNTVATGLTLFSRLINVTVNPAPPQITVTSPNGGEDWKIGSHHNITWTSNGTSGNVKIEYSTNGGNSWDEEVTSTTDDGSYSWTIPDEESTNCLVRVSDTDGSPSDISNAAFTISSIPPPPELVVTSPNGGEDWKVDSTYNITWTSNSTSGEVNIEYSTDNGSVWNELVSSVPDTGIYSWTIPDTPTDSCLVRISDTDGDPADVSDSVFSISTSSAVPEDKFPLVYSMSVKTMAVSNKFEIIYSIPENTSVKLELYNINGTKIAEFREVKAPGIYSKEIDMGSSPAGAYFIEMKVEVRKVVETAKVVLVK